LIISCSNFISLYNLSPFVIHFHKIWASYWYKRLHWGRWLTIDYIFYGHHHICWNDTTCSPWDTSNRTFDLDINRWDTSPYVIAWVIHLIDLSSCWWGMHSSFYDHLKLRITYGTIVLYGWYHV
jgi:hypothetical protein